MPRILIAVYALLVGLPALGMLAASSYVLWTYRDQRSWPSIEGRLLALSVRLEAGYRKHHWNVVADYVFEVQGQSYEISGQVVTTHFTKNAADQQASRISGQMDMEEHIDVFYNPRDPSIAMLVVGGNWHCWLFVAISLFFIMLPLAYFLI